MKKISRVVAMLLALVVSFLCLSEAAFAADNTTAANTRTSNMFKFFRDDRTTLDTTSVSPDELAVFGVFLSNFMIPGKTTLKEFFNSDSDINKTVSTIFFGSDKNSGTIGNLTKMLGDAITNGEGLEPLQIKASGTPTELNLNLLKQSMIKNDSNVLYYGEKPIINMNSTAFRLSMAEVLAVSLTYEQKEKNIENKIWLGNYDAVKNNEKIKEIGGIFKWLTDDTLKSQKIMIDCIGNFWLELPNGDYSLFIPACLQSFVMCRDVWGNANNPESSYRSKIPLVNSFYMGCMINLKNVSNYNSFTPFINILAASTSTSTNAHNNAINMCVIESSFLSKDSSVCSKAFNDTFANQEVKGLLNTSAFMKSAQNNYVDKESRLLIDASWSNFFYANADIKNEESNYCQLFRYMFEACNGTNSGGNFDYFLKFFCFVEAVDLKDCITDIYYFDTNTNNHGNGKNWQSDDIFGDNETQKGKGINIANNDYFKETLFKSSDNGNAQYNAVVSSNFNSYLIAVQNILGHNEEADGVQGNVDWSFMATTDAYDNMVKDLHVPNCNVTKILDMFENTSEITSTKYKVGDTESTFKGVDIEQNMIGVSTSLDFNYLFQHIDDGNSNLSSMNFYSDEWDFKNEKDSRIAQTENDKNANTTRVDITDNRESNKTVVIDGVEHGHYIRTGYRPKGSNETLPITKETIIGWLNERTDADSVYRQFVNGNKVYYCINFTDISYYIDKENNNTLAVELTGDCISIEAFEKVFKNEGINEIEPRTLLKPYDQSTVNNTNVQRDECCPFHKILYTYFKYNCDEIGYGLTTFTEFKKYLNKDGNELLAPSIVLYSITGNTRLIAAKASNYNHKELGLKILNLYSRIGSNVNILGSNMIKDEWKFIDVGDGSNNEDGINDLLEDLMTSSHQLGTNSQQKGNQNNIVMNFLYGDKWDGNKVKAFATFKQSNLKTSFVAVDNNTMKPVSVYSLTPLGNILVGSSYFLFFSITSSEGVKAGPWDFSKTNGRLFNWDGDIGKFDDSYYKGDNKRGNAAFIGGLNVMLHSMYNYRIASIRSSLAKVLSANSSYNCEKGQFVANGTNLWPGIYWGYMRNMLFVVDGNNAVLSSYDNPCLPRMNAATKGGGLQLSDLTSRETGLEPIEEMTMEQKQEDLINKALLILSTETSEYRDNWFKSMIDSWLISAHKSVIGTYTNSQLSFNQGVETGSTTYASVTGYVSTPQLTDISITKTIVDNYGVIYVIMIVIVIVYLIALVITGAKGIKESIFVAVILSIVLVFPQILLNNTIGIMNSVVDSMYSDRFNFWAIAKHQSSLNALADAKGKSNAEYVVASNIEMAKQVYSTDQGVRIKWPSPKKIDNFKAIFSDAIDNPNSTVNLTIFKTLFNSFFNQEQYTYDALETYSYRTYNTIANEAKDYYDNYIRAKASIESEKMALSVAFSAIKETLYGDSNKDSDLYEEGSYDNTTYSDTISENGGSYAKVDVSVALACMLNSELNGLFEYDWDELAADEGKEEGITPSISDESASLKLYYAYSESVFYYFYNVLKSEWSTDVTNPKRLKDAMLETDTFEKKFAKGSKAYIRDFLGLEYLFEYVIPYLNEGNVYVQSYIDKYGMDISRYDFTAGDKITVGTGDDEKTQEELEEYNKAKVQKEEYGQVWLLYSSWVDQLYSACGIEKVGKERFCAINAADYQTYLGRDMVFSELDMQGEYDALSNGYKKVDYTALSSVEQKILKVLKNSYEDIMYLNNYWNYDEEVILTAAAMMATFNFNKEFSNYKVLGDSSVLYPQNFELQNFNYDAFLRLIIMNSTGESLTDTTDLYTRVIGKTSIFTGILLLLTDITAVIGIPALKLVILLILLLIGLAICLTCVTMQIKEVPRKLWICLLKPVLLFAVFTIAFAWVISLFVGTGLTSYVGSSSVSIVTNDPTITFLLLFLVNVIYIIGLVYLFIMLFKIAKREIKGVALAVSGAVAGAALAATTTVTSINKLKNINKIKGGKRKNKKGLEESFEGYENNANSDSIDGNSSGNAINTDGHTELDDSEIASSKNKSSILMNDLNSNEEEEENKANNKHKPEVEESRGTQVVTNETNGENTEKVNKPKESLGSKVATKYMNMAAGVQTGINSVKNSWGKIKTGAFKVKSGVSRVGKAVVDGDTYKSFAYSAITTAGNIKDNVVEKAVGVKDGIVEKAVKVKDTVVDTAKDFQEQFTAANELLAERSEQLANAREKEYEKAINDIIEKNQKMIVERQEKAAKYNEMVMNKKKNKLESSTGIVLAQL